MAQGLFAVVDTETTGLFPGGHDRIAEIAIVTMDRRGGVVDRWETLINPGRDLGKQSLHRIRARDILEAPPFEEIADELDWRLSGTVVVAHNLSFDARFLEAEFMRSQRPLPDYYLPAGLCTMRMAHEYLPGAGRSLQDCCDAFSIDLQNAHCAGDDAAAAAELLARYMELDSGLPDWDLMLDRAANQGWHFEAPQKVRAPVIRPSGTPERSVHFLERIVVRLPEFTGPAEHDSYLAILDRALLDRELSSHEETQLVETANALGISRTRAEYLHNQYFEALVAAAWSDGVLSDVEVEDLARVANLLKVDQSLVEGARTPPTLKSTDSEATTKVPTFDLAQGALVVLTGDMSRPRADIEAHLRSAGYVPHAAVTKKVKLLVASDPDSLSGKARKARDYGIPVVGESFLWDQLLKL